MFGAASRILPSPREKKTSEDGRDRIEDRDPRLIRRVEEIRSTATSDRNCSRHHLFFSDSYLGLPKNIPREYLKKICSRGIFERFEVNYPSCNLVGGEQRKADD